MPITSRGRQRAYTAEAKDRMGGIVRDGLLALSHVAQADMTGPAIVSARSADQRIANKLGVAHRARSEIGGCFHLKACQLRKP